MRIFCWGLEKYVNNRDLPNDENKPINLLAFNDNKKQSNYLALNDNKEQTTLDNSSTIKSNSNSNSNSNADSRSNLRIKFLEIPTEFEK